MKDPAKTVGGISLSPLAYFGLIIGILKILGYEINLGILVTLIKSPAFLIGLFTSIGATVFLTMTLKRLQPKIEPKRVLRGVLRTIPFALLVIGAIFIFLSYRMDLWNNVAFNPSVFGAGVSVMAIGIAFLFAVYPRRVNHEGASALTNKIETLNAKFNKLENVIDCFLDESQKLAERIDRITTEGEKRHNR